jgi:hypothetical protein
MYVISFKFRMEYVCWTGLTHPALAMFVCLLVKGYLATDNMKEALFGLREKYLCVCNHVMFHIFSKLLIFSKSEIF